MQNFFDVALLKRLRKSKDWLYRLCCALFEERGISTEAATHRTPRLIDATVVKEPGQTGSLWRIHYSFRWPAPACDYFKITATEGKGSGESLRQFPLHAQDYVLVDRGYRHASGIHYAFSKKAFLIVRLNPDGILLQAENGSKFGLLESLKSIAAAGQMGQWEVLVPFKDNAPASARLCVVRKSQTAIALAHKKLRRYASKHGHTQLQPGTLLYAQYVMFLTTSPKKIFLWNRFSNITGFAGKSSWCSNASSKLPNSATCLNTMKTAPMPGFTESCLSPCSPRNSSGMPTPFLPGDSRWRTKRPPSRWREFSFAFHQITKAIEPTLALDDMLASWGQIPKRLADAPRQRKSQEQAYL